MRNTILLTGATGLVGGRVLAALLARDPGLDIVVLVREPARWRVRERRVQAVAGDLTRPDLGLDPARRVSLLRTVTGIVHAAGDVRFTRPLDDLRAVNVDGTRRVMELAADCHRLERVLYVGTAAVCGRRTGLVREADNGPEAGWVNAYQQSKYEGEAVVRASAVPWVVARPTTIVLDGARGGLSQFTAVHHALRLLHEGLVPMIPAARNATLDATTNEYVSDALAELLVRPTAVGRTVHLCAGAGAMSVADLLELTWTCWEADAAWRRKTIPRPAFADLSTWQLFASSVGQTGDQRLVRAVTTLSSFVPDLAYPKRFDTANAEAILGRPAPALRDIWPTLLRELLATGWANHLREAAA